MSQHSTRGPKRRNTPGYPRLRRRRPANHPSWNEKWSTVLAGSLTSFLGYFRGIFWLFQAVRKADQQSSLPIENVQNVINGNWASTRPKVLNVKTLLVILVPGEGGEDGNPSFGQQVHLLYWILPSLRETLSTTLLPYPMFVDPQFAINGNHFEHL